MNEAEIKAEQADLTPESELVQAWRMGSDRERLLRQLSGSVLLELLRALKKKTRASHVQAIHPEDAWADRVADYALEDALCLQKPKPPKDPDVEEKRWDPINWTEKTFNVRVAIIADADWYDNRVAPITLDLVFEFKHLGTLMDESIEPKPAARQSTPDLEPAPWVEVRLSGFKQRIKFPLPLIKVHDVGDAKAPESLAEKITAAITELDQAESPERLTNTQELIRELRRFGHNGVLASIFESTVAERNLSRPSAQEKDSAPVSQSILRALLEWSKASASADGYQQIEAFAAYIWRLLKSRLITEGGHNAPRQGERVLLPGGATDTRGPGDTVISQ